MSFYLFENNETKKKEGGLRTKGLWKKGSLEQPLISVITVVFNGAKYIEQTIQSVVNQQYENVEYIIIDGDSTDQTIDIIKKYEHLIDYWISEKDNGIYDAMNKGINLSIGQWINFLGSDDRFFDSNVLLSIEKELSSSLKMIYGNSFYQGNQTIRSNWSAKIFLHNTIHHQSAFYNSTLFDHWRYDEQFQLMADYELNLILYINYNKLVKKININIAISYDQGLSRIFFWKVIKETSEIRKKQLGNLINFFINIIFLIKFTIVYFKNKLIIIKEST